MDSLRNNRQFTLFHNLPPELRLQIWELTKRRQAVLEVRLPLEAKLLARALPPPAASLASFEGREAVFDAGRTRADQPQALHWQDELHIAFPRQTPPVQPCCWRQALWFDEDDDITYWNANSTLGSQTFQGRHLGESPGALLRSTKHLMLCKTPDFETRLRDLVPVCPRLQTLSVLIGGVDLDFRTQIDDPAYRYALIDLEDESAVGQVRELIEHLPFDRSGPRHHWQRILECANGEGFASPELPARAGLELIQAQSLDCLQLDEGLFQEQLPMDWAQLCHRFQTQWLDHRNVEFKADKLFPEWKWRIVPTAHTAEFQRWSVAILPEMPTLRRVAIVRMYGDVGSALQEKTVEVGRILRRPRFEGETATSL